LSDFGGVLRKKHADDDGLLSADPVASFSAPGAVFRCKINAI
jgi:hypothetical protein